jgi:hypothetical protein
MTMRTGTSSLEHHDPVMELERIPKSLAALAAVNRSAVDLIQLPTIWLILNTIMMSFRER